jgi:hypothetical protein
MKKIIILLSLLLSTQILAEPGISGCYKTIEFNGQVVNQGPSAENSQSEIYITKNQYYRDLETGTELETLIISVFNGFRQPWYGFSNVVVPVNKGQWNITQDSVKYEMDEDILYINSNYQRSKVDFLINLSLKKSGSRLVGDLYFSSISRGLFYDFSVVLEKAHCL